MLQLLVLHNVKGLPNILTRSFQNPISPQASVPSRRGGAWEEPLRRIGELRGRVPGQAKPRHAPAAGGKCKGKSSFWADRLTAVFIFTKPSQRLSHTRATASSTARRNDVSCRSPSSISLKKLVINCFRCSSYCPCFPVFSCCKGNHLQ